MLVTDARLVVLRQGEAWMSYTSHMGSPACRGSWIARLTGLASYRCAQGRTPKTLDPLRKVGAFRKGVKGFTVPCNSSFTRVQDATGHWAVLHPTQGGGGAGIGALDADRTESLASPRNSGIIVDPNTGAPLYELVNVAPRLELRAPNGVYTRRDPPATFATRGLHNSMHPLWLPEWSVYLGAAHRHYGEGRGPYFEDSSIPFHYGYSYRQVLFTLTPGDVRIRRFTRELCLPSLEAPGRASGATTACDSIQFVMGAFRTPEGAVGLSYGVQDCESALLTLTLARLRELLEFGE